ncbi:hypothetical protein [Flavobacterium pallidum]|uniref:Lipocalin-like domain-containing protein n=1 Tax=Flavobacterium pallidum TaxID=2172098 RepID=A0A2S1SKH9_9FLAO|nr:hypothetical protein [Flavobacterium pallidum]AWI26881.1 hypothetical protein HYN49_13750 [Flavobacterium pallidum]
MKKILILLLIALYPKINYAQTDNIAEKIQGQWIFEKTRSVEQLPDATSGNRETVPDGKITVYFKADNTGNFNFPDKDSEKFT